MTEKQLIWHPCSQMQDYELFKPLNINKASGSYLELTNGSKIIDAISSWWCKSLGHSHPRLKAALLEQVEKFEHVIFANTTYEKIIELSTMLGNLLPHLNKVFYAGDGSSAVEIAMKMSIHARNISCEKHKTKFIALSNGYHGETAGALSVSDVGIFRDPYQAILFDTFFITPNYVHSVTDNGWTDAAEHWQMIEPLLLQQQQETTAIIVEPIMQGAAGMRMYSQDFLYRLAKFAKEHNIHLIADEIMTGVGRTGKMLACEHAAIQPDFLCLSKGLTSGWLAFSAVLTTDDIYQTFYDDHASGKAFLHSHTYSGNALGACLAVATLQEIYDHKLINRADELQKLMRNYFETIATTIGAITNIRGIGAIVAADLVNHNNTPRLGYQVFQDAIKLGALLRPIGNTIYWLPPLNIAVETLQELYEITLQAVLRIPH
jgi:adenosylmethionine-8-amino-7-oxononanoate aminotransferase